MGDNQAANDNALSEVRLEQLLEQTGIDLKPRLKQLINLLANLLNDPAKQIVVRDPANPLLP